MVGGTVSVTGAHGDTQNRSHGDALTRRIAVPKKTQQNIHCELSKCITKNE